MSRKGKYAFSPAGTDAIEAIMPMVAFIAENLIFYVAGIVVWTALAANLGAVRGQDALVLYCVLQVTRGAVVFLLFPLLRQMGYQISKGEGAIVVWAGLRGAVSLSLSLMVLGNSSLSTLDLARIHFLTVHTAKRPLPVPSSSQAGLFAQASLPTSCQLSA